MITPNDWAFAALIMAFLLATIATQDGQSGRPKH